MLQALVTLLVSPLLTATTLSPTADVFVDINAANCATGVGSAVDPVCSIAEAISLAAPGDTIRIAPGTYLEHLTAPFDLELVGTSGAALTIVDGSFTGTVLTIPAAVSVEVTGLTIQRGRSNEGGGIKVSGELILVNSTVSNNSSIHGAGIAADMLGGGAQVTIRDSVVSDNHSSFTNDGSGAVVTGGGIAQNGGALAILNSTISGNTATIYYDYCTFFCNYSDSGRGGGIYAVSTDLSISNSTVSDCKSDAFLGSGTGGGLYARRCTLNVANTTFSGNVSRNGRSLITSQTNAGSVLSSVTITGDQDAGALGGSFSSSVRLDGPVEMRNCLVAGNSSIVLGSVTSLGHNLFDTGALGVTHGVNGDLAGVLGAPLLASLHPLADNGGPTQTHALALGNLAVDAGDPVTFEPTDQRGVARPAFGLPDIGAFEAESPAPARDFCSGTRSEFSVCANCPCDNNAPLGTIGGCLNSAGRSARITATGDTSISLPPLSATDLRITMTGATSNAFSVMYSGDAIAPGGMANPCFGLQTGVQSLAFDGLRCAILNTRRHGGRPTDSNGDVGITNNEWGGTAGPPVGLGTQAGFVAGQTRYFQAEYREDSTLGCMRGLNTSQAVEITFTP